MDLVKSAIPYALLYVADANYMHMELGPYLLVTAVVLFTQVTRYFAGYKRGFHVAERIGQRIFVHLHEELGAETVMTAMEKLNKEK